MQTSSKKEQCSLLTIMLIWFSITYKPIQLRWKRYIPSTGKSETTKNKSKRMDFLEGSTRTANNRYVGLKYKYPVINSKQTNYCYLWWGFCVHILSQGCNCEPSCQTSAMWFHLNLDEIIRQNERRLKGLYSKCLE